MDSNALTTLRENMRKEQTFQKRWDEENNKRNGNDELEIEMLPPTKSAALHFLEQTNGLEGNPYDIKGKRKPGFDIQDLLYTGVSKEGEGRQGYLLNRRYEHPQSKYAAPCSESQEVGWASGKISSAPSPFSRKPIVQNTFFRPNGIPLKMDSN